MCRQVPTSGEDRRTAEIALNPDTFEDRTDMEILNTLAHEMCHLWQHYFGKPSRGGYHNREWATMMEKIGLMPSSTSEPGGGLFIPDKPNNPAAVLFRGTGGGLSDMRGL